MLRASPTAAAELLANSIDEGQVLLERASLIGDYSDYESWKGARKLWSERTAEGLARIYDGTEEAEDFRNAAFNGGGPDAAGEKKWQIEYKRDSNRVREAIDILIALQHGLGISPGDDPRLEEKLELREELGLDEEPALEPGAHASENDADLDADPAEPEPEPDAGDVAEPEPSPADPAEAEPEVTFAATLARSPDPEDEPPSAPLPAPLPSPGVEVEPGASPQGQPSVQVDRTGRLDRGGRVFLVHGRDEKFKQAVAGLLERAGPHEVTILNERPTDRKMLVEQFEEHSAESRYAVVLLTADDVGAPRLDSDNEPYYSPRARQGVVFEMGVLVAALTPRCMCVLYEDGVELPCDIDGIAYVRLDLAGTWQSKLLLHMRNAGFDYDLNELAPI